MEYACECVKENRSKNVFSHFHQSELIGTNSKYVCWGEWTLKNYNMSIYTIIHLKHEICFAKSLVHWKLDKPDLKCSHLCL